MENVIWCHNRLSARVTIWTGLPVTYQAVTADSHNRLSARVTIWTGTRLGAMNLQDDGHNRLSARVTIWTHHDHDHHYEHSLHRVTIAFRLESRFGPHAL